ncbi:MAG: cob(I)yrinic acid a,c-diamide adenosyltransferase [Planctomycetota bacterium]
MRIYTGSGDGGETGLFGGGRVLKDHCRVEAYGTVDELNAAVGVARAAGLPDDLDRRAARLQEELLVLGADLATSSGSRARKGRTQRLDEAAVKEVEAGIDRCEEELEPLANFVLPGGTPAGAALHLARTVCRRAERRLVTLARTEEASAWALPYLNRVSDLLFVMARLVNARAGRPEQAWTPQ